MNRFEWGDGDFTITEPGEKEANLGGVMVALYPTPAVAAQLALEGADVESPEQLHLTLAYLGDAADFSDDHADRLRRIVEAYATAWPAIEGRVAGSGRFIGKPDESPLIALVDAPLLPEFRQRLVSAIEGVGLAVNHEHGFTPHITLAYAPDLAAEVKPLELRFNAVWVCIGQERHPFVLAAGR